MKSRRNSKHGEYIKPSGAKSRKLKQSRAGPDGVEGPRELQLELEQNCS